MNKRICLKDYINSSSNLSPRAAIKQAHPSPSIYVPLEEQMPVQAHRITRVYPEKVIYEFLMNELII